MKIKAKSLSIAVLLSLGAMSIFAQTIPYTRTTGAAAVTIYDPYPNTHGQGEPDTDSMSAQSSAFGTNCVESGSDGYGFFSETAAYGNLHAFATCNATNGGIEATASASAQPRFVDSITVLNPNLTNGAPVRVQFTASLHGTYSGIPNNIGDNYLQAWIHPGYNSPPLYLIPGRDIFKTNATLTVGDTYQIGAFLNVSLYVQALQPGNSDSALADCGNTATVHADAVTPGTLLVSASGHDYSTPPQLNITVSNAVLTLTWPASATSFALQTNGDLATTNWNDCGGIIATNGGAASVTVAPRAGNLFFRLKQ